MDSGISVLKRGGQQTQQFALWKIAKAIEKAFQETGNQPNEGTITQLSNWVKEKVLSSQPITPISVEIIQDFVETTLMSCGYTDEAKAYILYRSKHEGIRKNRLVPDPFAVANYIHPGKYSRYLPDKKRREIYEETVARVEGMHIQKFPFFKEEINEAFDFVRAKKLLPSMRSMQFGGDAIEKKNARIYNCAFGHIDKIRAFSDILYLLLCGCGVGYSIQFDHVEKLPPLGYINKSWVRHYTIDDSIEGWANALKALMLSYVKGQYIEFNYSKIREEGASLKTSGGKAPGHLGLKNSLEAIRKILDNAQGRQLRPIECYDIICLTADAVLSGGVRRSATIALFSIEDGEMMAAKTGKWFETAPWRANSNNSVVLKRGEVSKKIFKRIFRYIKEFGEPGFVFTNNYDYGFNPCVEINLNPVLVVDEEILEKMNRRREEGSRIPKANIGDTFTGFNFCNLTEINAAAFKAPQDIFDAARMAARIGTLQATYTKFPYLGWVSEFLVEREALLGVSMTGLLDAPEIAMDPELQKKSAAIVIEENKRVAKILGIEEASRNTCIKPGGSSSLELGCVGSGPHAHHARRYIRRVTAKEFEPVFQHFRSVNPHMCVKKPDGNWVIEFPVAAPEDAIVQDDLTAIGFLSMVKSIQQNWVMPGIAHPERSPGACHNVSNTVVVKPTEWEEVSEFVWQNQDVFSGISFLPDTGDKDYAFAPREKISTEADEDRWNQLIRHYTPVDYLAMSEEDDMTDLVGEMACAGGKCEI